MGAGHLARSVHKGRSFRMKDPFAIDARLARKGHLSRRVSGPARLLMTTVVREVPKKSISEAGKLSERLQQREAMKFPAHGGR